MADAWILIGFMQGWVGGYLLTLFGLCDQISSLCSMLSAFNGWSLFLWPLIGVEAYVFALNDQSSVLVIRSRTQLLAPYQPFLISSRGCDSFSSLLSGSYYTLHRFLVLNSWRNDNLMRVTGLYWDSITAFTSSEYSTVFLSQIRLIWVQGSSRSRISGCSEFIVFRDFSGGYNRILGWYYWIYPFNATQL